MKRLLTRIKLWNTRRNLRELWFQVQFFEIPYEQAKSVLHRYENEIEILEQELKWKKGN